MLRFERLAFWAMVLMALSLVIIPNYYITGDGASHTYNAKVLFDYVLGRDRAFYDPYFTINRAIDPNWMSHIVLGILQEFMPARLADKGFQVFYIVVFATGFRYLIRSIDEENGFLSLLFFPFVFTLPFQQGLYNYCIALGFMCWTIGYFIRYRHDLLDARHQLLVAWWLLITTFSHGMPAIYAMMAIGLITLLEANIFKLPIRLEKITTIASRYFLMIFPGTVMILLFMAKRGTGVEPHHWTTWHKFVLFLQGWTFQSTRHLEMYPAIAVGVLLLAYFAYLAFTPEQVNQRHTRHLSVVFLLGVGFTFFSYLTCPHSIGGAGSIDIRLCFLPWLFLLFFFATKQWNDDSKKIFIALAFVISGSFMAIRLPYILQADRIGQAIIKAGAFIPNKQVVLNLHMDDWQQLGNGDSLFHKDNSFIHFSDFLGAERKKSMILLNNYEAEINYFPVNWTPGMNPRASISGMIPGNYPPTGNILAYEQQSGRRIDYLLLQNDRNRGTTTNALRQQIDSLFTSVYIDPKRYVVLYKRKQ
jgi:hypothetical protein